MDIYSPTKRSQLMAKVGSRNTKPELRVRSTIHKLGFRFRVNRAALPGRPDIVLPRHKKVIFVHGCFWHQHVECAKARRPRTNVAFWDAKLDANVKRDGVTQQRLTDLGWEVMVVWECEARNKVALIPKLTGFLAHES